MPLAESSVNRFAIRRCTLYVDPHFANGVTGVDGQ